MSDHDPMTCIHREPGLTGLCGQCRAEYEEDPSAWLEFGAYPAGLERWRKLQEEIAADAELREMGEAGAPANDESIPF